MKKTLVKSLALAVVGSMMMAGGAMALSVTLDDGNDGSFEYYITDGGAGDGNALAGMVQFNANVGDWTSNVTIGTSYPALGTSTNPMLDLFSLSLDYAPNQDNVTGGTIAISVTDTYASFGDLNASITGFAASIGGTAAGTVDFLADINGVEIAIGWDDMIHTINGGFAAGDSFALSDYVFGDNDIWDMTLTAVITQGAGITTFNAAAAPVPEPATMFLLGTGLVGLAGVTRRRKANKA